MLSYALFFQPDNVMPTQFKDRVKTKRKEAGLTQAQIAEFFGISNVSVSEWERGLSKPDQAKLEGLSRLLKTSVNYLVTGVDVDHIKPATAGAKLNELNNSVVISSEENYNAGRQFDLPKGKFVAVVGTGRAGPDGLLSITDYGPGDGDGYIYTYSQDLNAYGIRVQGDSMRPRIKSGEFIVAEPGVEAQPGDDVVVKLRDGRSMVKEFLWARDGEMSFGSVNNGYAPCTHQASEIESIHRVAAIVPRSSALLRSRQDMQDLQ
jgi:phage repressor protein C with HTH and peptisase S24 domain